MQEQQHGWTPAKWALAIVLWIIILIAGAVIEAYLSD